MTENHIRNKLLMYVFVLCSRAPVGHVGETHGLLCEIADMLQMFYLVTYCCGLVFGLMLILNDMRIVICRRTLMPYRVYLRSFVTVAVFVFAYTKIRNPRAF